MSDHDIQVTVSHELFVRELSSVVGWDVLGLYLGLEESEINVIERDHHDTARRRIAMLSKWMEKDAHASWEKVIDALKSMSLITLANQLREKYGTEFGVANNPRPEREMMLDRQESIAQEIQNFENEYIQLVTKVETAMSEINPSLIKLKRFSQYYNEKSRVTTVEELFDQLNPLCFLDYALIEQIVKFFLKQHTVADDLHDYLQQLDKFKSSTTVEQFMKGIEQAQQPDTTTQERPGLCTVTLRLVGGWLDKTVEDLQRLVKEIFKDKSCVLSHLKIVRGSVIVTYSAPQSEVESLIMLALEQSSFIAEVGVIELMVRDTMIAHSDSLDYSFEYFLFRAIIVTNDLNLLRFLLCIKTNPDARFKEIPALCFAVHYKRDKALSQLIKANADINLQTTDGSTPLFIASHKGLTGVVSLLLKANADINLQTADGATPLFVASQEGHVDIVSLLLKANADIDLQTAKGATPLFIASAHGHAEIVSLLLKANADINLQTDFKGATPIYIASQQGHTSVVSLLLKANADINLRTADGASSLFIASQKGHTDIVSYLLKANADINLQMADGATPLFIASQNGYTNIVSLLLKATADKNLQTAQGATPLFIA